MYDILAEQFSDTMAREGKLLHRLVTTTDVGGFWSKEIRGFFRTVTDSEINNISKTYFYCDGQSVLLKGECISNGKTYWLTLTKENEDIETSVYSKFLVAKTNYNINFNFNNEIVPIRAVIGDLTASLGGSGVTIQTGKVSIVASDDADSRRLFVNQRMIIGGGNAYVITSLMFVNGLANIWAEPTTVNPNDDLINEIPDYKPTPPAPAVVTYTVTPTLAELLQGEFETFTFNRLEDGVIVSSSWEFSGSGAVVGTNYTLTKVGTNGVKIVNKKQSQTPLTLTGLCTDAHSEVIQITLRGEY